MLTVIIPYQGDKVALSQLLVSIQPQLHPDDDIYILDWSEYRSAKHVVERYGSTRCYIFVEPTEDQENYKFGFQSMRENKQEGALLLPPTAVIPTTFIANLKKAVKKEPFDVFMFSTVKSDVMDPNFKWFTPPPVVSPLRLGDIIKGDDDIVYGPCFLRDSVVPKDLDVDLKKEVVAGMVTSESVLILPFNY